MCEREYIFNSVPSPIPAPVLTPAHLAFHILLLLKSNKLLEQEKKKDNDLF